MEFSCSVPRAGEMANGGRDNDKDKSVIAFTCSPAGGFGLEKQCQGREEELLAEPWDAQW